MRKYEKQNFDEWYRHRNLIVELQDVESMEQWRTWLYSQADLECVNLLDRSTPTEWLDEEIAWQLQKGRVTERELPRWVRALPTVAEELKR